MYFLSSPLARHHHRARGMSQSFAFASASNLGLVRTDMADRFRAQWSIGVRPHVSEPQIPLFSFCGI
jgi:hypothetical protein